MPSLQPFMDDLYLPSTLSPISDDGKTRVYRMAMKNGARKLHSKLPTATPFWGYEGQYPGPIVEVPRDRQVIVTFANSLNGPADPANPRTQWPFAIAPDDSAGMPYFVPAQPWTVVHLHGSPTRPEYDGWADNAYFPGEFATHHYPPQENATMLWYHDHGNMITRLNVYAGLAGMYIVRDPSTEAGLPAGDFEIPLLLQDRDFEVRSDRDEFTGRFAYQSLTSNNIFQPGFFLVNGVVTPFKKVERARYRLRFLNGANSRIFRLAFRTESAGLSTKEWEVIGVDGGFFTPSVKNPKTTTSSGPKEFVALAPAERLDVLIDFSQFPVGTNVELVHLRPTGALLGPVMQFQVVAGAGPQGSSAPSVRSAVTRSPRVPRRYSPSDDQPRAANAPVPALRQRTIGLYVKNGMQTINGLMFHDRIEEKPELDSEEIWTFLNITGDEHPLHLHLVNFEVIDRQAITTTSTDPDYISKFDSTFRDWLMSASPPPLPPGLDVAPGSSRVPADAYEREPKDTVRVPSFTLTRIKIKFRIHTGLYMYHCHILEHEDMEMMRPMLVKPKGMPEMMHDRCLDPPNIPHPMHDHG